MEILQDPIVTRDEPNKRETTVLKVLPLKGERYQNAVKRRITETAFGGQTISQTKQFTGITRARIHSVIRPINGKKTQKFDEEYLTVSFQYGPGQYERVTAYSTDIENLEKALELQTTDPTVDHFDLLTTDINVYRRVQGGPSEKLDGHGSNLVGIVAVHEDGTEEEILPFPGVPVGQRGQTNQGLAQNLQ